MKTQARGAREMDENEFYVAIQGIMTAAHEQGWDIDQVEQTAIEAAEEWLEEMEKSLPTDKPN